MDVAIFVVSVLTLIAALLSVFASSRFWFRPRVPIDVGFLYNGTLTDSLTVSTGDPAKPIEIRFLNSSEFTIPNLVLDIKFMNPVALSGTQSAVQQIPNHTYHGRVSSKEFYHLAYFDLTLYAKYNIDTRVELNTQGISPGRYKVKVALNTEQPEYRAKERTLILQYQ